MEFEADWLIVDENVYDSVARTTEISRRQIQQVLDVARYVDTTSFLNRQEPEGLESLAVLMEAAELLIRCLTRPGATSRIELDLPRITALQPLQRVWWWANRDAKQAGEGPADGVAFRSLLDILSGAADQVWVRTAARNVDWRSGEARRTDCHLIVRSVRDLTSIAPRVLLLDGTASVDSLQSMARSPVVEITPRVRLPQRHPVYLFEEQDIAKSERRSFRRILSILRAAIVAFHGFQEYPRIGVIGHRNQIDRLRKHLEPAFGQWVQRWSYFGRGDDRGDNNWYRDCSGLIKLGTVRCPKRQIADHLIRIGRGEAAGRDGAWGEVSWRDINGKLVQGRGYQDEDWRLAYHDLAAAADQQVLGRARASLPDGIASLVFSSAYHSGAVAMGCLPPISAEVADVVSRTLGPLYNEAARVCDNVPCEMSLTENDRYQDSMKRKKAEANPAAMLLAERRAVASAVALGLLQRPSPRKPPVLTSLARRIWMPVWDPFKWNGKATSDSSTESHVENDPGTGAWFE
jgi:hypothetical protein